MLGGRLQCLHRPRGDGDLAQGEERSFQLATQGNNRPAPIAEPLVRAGGAEGRHKFRTRERPGRDDISWWRCRRDEEVFHAACGVNDLAEVLDIFIAWTNHPSPSDS